MKDLRELQQGAAAARRKLAAAEERVARLRGGLREREARRQAALRRGEAGGPAAASWRAESEGLVEELAASARSLAAAREEFRQQLLAVTEEPWKLVEQLGDDLPFLLLPLRIETRFMPGAGGAGRELWLRIFPDEIAVHTHEPQLRDAEAEGGEAFWREMWAAAQQSDPEKRRTLEQSAWTRLATSFDSRRAGFIARETRPATLDVASAESLSFPPRSPGAPSAEAWSRAPRTQVMPDRFVAMGYLGGKQVFRQLGEPVPDPLILGPDPQILEAEYRQDNGELVTGPDFAWIHDFDEAVRNGMGLRIPLTGEVAAGGLDRLLVLGLRLSSDADAAQSLVEELFDNHHYSPGGMSFVAQGTPTNNTGDQGSGYSSAGPAPEESLALEIGPPAFEPTAEPGDKTDGQLLAEALGIAYGPLQRLAGAGRQELREARLGNTSLFPATAGYYLEEMLGLDLATVGRVREFFTAHVTGRGPLAAIRVGNQPYGLLLTSDFSKWTWSAEELGGEAAFLDGLLEILRRFGTTWRELARGAARIGATGDPEQDLLRALGLNPASVEHHRRHATGNETLWNLQAFFPGPFYGPALIQKMRLEARFLLQELGLSFDPQPRLFDLAFFQGHDQVLDPLVDDIPAEETEKLAEAGQLKKIYRVPDPSSPGGFAPASYLGWLAHGAYDDLKLERLLGLDGEALPAPRPLFYRLLRSALLLSVHDAATRIYTRFGVLPLAARREVEIANVARERTVTRWEMMDARIGRVLPGLSTDDLPLGAWLATAAGRAQPEALTLEELRRALAGLIELPTARLERILVEHLDLCSYRLDAWQMGCFARRLAFQRRRAIELPVPGLVGDAHVAGSGEETPPDALRRQGVYLGAFGWLEDLRPAPPLQKAETTGIPSSLYDPQRDGELFEQLDSGGFIHGPSLNHAVAAAVLRGAYLTHFDPAKPETMAVNLSSARVRTALSFLEGVRNGQELGALLGYQFERGLHDGHGDPSLNQYIPLFRARYPLVADRITPSADGTPIETKESRHVLDGYALVEAAFLRKPRLAYPYGVNGLPNAASAHGAALRAEVARLNDSLDAVADLLLAEGVFQVTQGNFERAAASLKTLTEGGLPPDPEIVATPRSGAPITQRLALHFATGAAASFWPGAATERARAEPELNRWLGERLPTPGRIRYQASWEGQAPQEKTLADLAWQPIDLVLMAGDDLTELETRLAYAVRRAQNDDALVVKLEFLAPPADPGDFSLFELLPLLRSLRDLVTTARPLSALDYHLPSEANTNPAEGLNPQGYDLAGLDARVQDALGRFTASLASLAAAIPVDGERAPIFASIDADMVRSALLALAGFGLADALPVSAVGDGEDARRSLAEQGLRWAAIGAEKAGRAAAARSAAADPGQPAAARLKAYRLAAQEIFGASFSLIPGVTLDNPAELAAAAAFRDLPPGQGLQRFHPDNPLLLDEWLQGVARVRPAAASLEQIFLLGELAAVPADVLSPLQLPFRDGDYWVATEFPAVAPEQIGQPGVFYPQGEFVSLVQCLPAGGFDPAAVQKGLLVDEWTEVIPGPVETTGIAVHYNQPSTEPPQALLLALSPELTGKWTWAKLEGILIDTLERAKERAVEPDQLAGTAFGHLLPAVLTAVASRPFATISTDLIHATASIKP